MEKSVLKSKTMWGFGLAALIGIAQAFGIVADANTVANLMQILTALFGAYGMRDAIAKNGIA